VEVSGRGRSANLSKICLGSPQIFQPNKDKGCDAVATVQRGRFLMAGQSLGLLVDLQGRERKRIRKEQGFVSLAENQLNFEMCKVLVQGW
jgi:hypothetical protein